MSGSACPQPRRWRLALSALLDGEPLPMPRPQLDAHLAVCPDCSAWFARARHLDRHLRLAELRPPDLTAHLMGVVEAHVCGCHTGGACRCTNCQCPTCTCRPDAAAS